MLDTKKKHYRNSKTRKVKREERSKHQLEDGRIYGFQEDKIRDKNWRQELETDIYLFVKNDNIGRIT